LGAREVQRAITASTLTTIAVFGPIIYVEGVAGQLFSALSLSVAFSLLVSLVVAMTLLPMMASRWSEGTEKRITWAPIARPLDGFERGFARVAAWYERMLALALANRLKVAAASVVLFALTLPVAFSLDRSVLPEVDQGSFRTRIELPEGTPLESTQRLTQRVEQALLAEESIDAVFSEVGRRAAITGVEEDRSGLNTAQLEVRLKDGQSTYAVLERLRPQFADLPAGTVTFETGHATALGKLLGGGEADLSVRVRGDDLNSSIAYAKAIEQKLAGSERVTNVRLGTEIGQPEFLLEINRERAAAFGIEPRKITDVIERAMAGRIATEFVDFDRKIPILVRLPESARYSLQTLELLDVDGVPLRELVKISESVTVTEIRRSDQSRIVPVFADVREGGVDDAVADVRSALAGIQAPARTRAEIGGENEEMRRSFRELAFAFTLALLLVYMILAAEFESLKHPFTILLSVPLALIGAVWALWAFGAGLNTISLIGIVILVGIVDNDAVVKIDFINQMRREGMSVREAIIAAGHDRFRPIVMNTLTVMLSVLPMMFGIGAGAALQAPLAIAVFGGLFTATALTLIVIPVVYELIEEGVVRVHGHGHGHVHKASNTAALVPAGD
jgi:HAE1 family hydrophobic/amphiphilic exporter-1